MASIGGLALLELKGGFGPPGQTLEDITRAGVDGVAYRHNGVRAEPVELRSLVEAEDADDVADILESYALLQGTVVDIVTEEGITWASVAVLTVMHVETLPIRSAVGGLVANPEYLVRARWVVQATVP